MKKLKIWNGRGWGTTRYDTNGQRMFDPTGRIWCDHIYVCAHSIAEAVKIVNEAAGYTAVSPHEVNVYWNKNCWGNPMRDITPEVGVWTQQHHCDKPKRVWPIKDGEKNENSKKN